MFQNIGPIGLLLIVIVALLLFGPNKLPELGRALGRTMREFKEGTKDLLKDDDKNDAAKSSTNTTQSTKERNEVEAQYSEVDSKKDKNLPE